MNSASKIRIKQSGRRHSAVSDYGSARVRDKAFDAVRKLWDKRQAEGLRVKDVADKIGADRGWVSKHLRGPGNWTLRTFGALVEGMNGEAEILVFPLEEPLDAATNYDAYYDSETKTERSGSSIVIKPHRDVKKGQETISQAVRAELERV